MILVCSIFFTPSLGVSGDEDFEEFELNLKVLLVIGGRINVCNDENQLYGFGTIVYTDGETSILKSYVFNFKGIPFFVTKGLLISICIYTPADI